MFSEKSNQESSHYFILKVFYFIYYMKLYLFMLLKKMKYASNKYKKVYFLKNSKSKHTKLQFSSDNM